MTAARTGGRLEGVRVAFLSSSQAGGRFDWRTLRMAGTVVAEGGMAVVYARWEPGLAPVDVLDGHRVVRVPVWRWAALPGTGWLVRRRLRGWLAEAARVSGGEAAGRPTDTAGSPAGGSGEMGATGARGISGAPDATTRRGATLRRRLGGPVRAWRQLRLFPITPLAWAATLDAVVEPADVWHGMWAASLPALARLRRHHGGRTIYDSRDIYLHARAWEHVDGAIKSLATRLERRWARGADAVVTVNDPYADILERTLGIARPIVVRNTPPRWTRPDPPPDLIRDELDLPARTRIVLYQGGLMTERGIEEGMAAIEQVPDAVLVLLGFGAQTAHYRRLAGSDRHRARVRLLPPVPPTDLLAWTAAADVMLMAIQPTSLNHRYTTPQKLWEAIAAGTPVVAGDLPAMSAVVRQTGCGVLCDPTDPDAIARAIRTILDAPAERREAWRQAARRAAERYNWEVEAETLVAVYSTLLADGSKPRPAGATDPAGSGGAAGSA